MINQKYGKVWGTTQKIFSNDNVSIHRINILSGGQCSKHKHLYKHNMFFVEKGKLKIDIWQNDYDLIDSTILAYGESITVEPNLYHIFTALEETIAYEIYYSKIDDKDIIRKNIGKIITNL